MCGGCPKCGVEDRPEVDLSPEEVIDCYRDQVQSLRWRFKMHPEEECRWGYTLSLALQELAEEYRAGTFKRRMDEEQEEAMMRGDYNDPDDYNDDD
jgi:hypothetical protein